MKKILLLILIFLSISSINSQTKLKETKYIYALDITLSMWGSGNNPDIFDEVRKELINSIKAIESPDSEIIIYTFQNEIIDTWSVEANQKGKQFLIDKLNSIQKNNVPKQNTNIYKAWKTGKYHVDPFKINVFFLLTDGNHTVRNTPKSKLYQVVKDWNKKQKNIYSFAFLVELTEKAKDANLRHVVDETINTQVITGISFSVLDVENKVPTVNINDDMTFNFNLVANSTHNFDRSIYFSVQSNDSNFEIVDGENILFENLPVKLQLKPLKDIEILKKDLDQNVKINAVISFDEKSFPDTKLLMKKFDINLINKKEKVLKVEVN